MFDWDLDFKLNMTWMLSEQQGERKPNKGRNLRNRRQLSVGAPGQVAVISEGSTSDCLSIIVTDEFMLGALLVLICSYENIITVLVFEYGSTCKLGQHPRITFFNMAKFLFL
jgi:hypothetical protein